jgi:hypothetical protein
MDPLLLGALCGGGLLLVALLLGRLNSYWKVAIVSAIISLCFGLYFNFFSWEFSPSGYHPKQIWLLIAWIEFAHLISISGLRPRGNLGALAFCGGALLSDLGAAALLAPFAGSIRNRGRVALTASAGAMLTTGGTPAVLLFDGLQIEPIWALVLALIVWPKGSVQRDPTTPMQPFQADNSKRRWIIPGCILAIVLMEVGLPPFWVISGLDILLIWMLGFRRATTPWRSEIYIFAIASLTAVAVSSGSLHQLQLGMNWLVQNFGDFGLSGVAIFAGILSGFGGEAAGSLVLHQSIEQVAYGPEPALQQAVVMGLAVGGIGPLIVAKAFKKSIGLLTLQFGLMLLLIVIYGV